MFKIHISRLTPKGVIPKEFLVEKFGLYVNRYPDDHPLEGNTKDLQLAIVDDENKITTYPFIGLWISVEDSSEEEKPQ